MLDQKYKNESGLCFCEVLVVKSDVFGIFVSSFLGVDFDFKGDFSDILFLRPKTEVESTKTIFDKK